MDVASILAYGFTGFGFLLAYLSYRIIKKELSRPTIRKSMIALTFGFMVFSIALAVLAQMPQLFSNPDNEISLSNSPDLEKSFFQGKWSFEATDIINETGGKIPNKGYKYEGTLTFEINKNEIEMKGYYFGIDTVNNLELTRREIEGVCYYYTQGSLLRVLYRHKKETSDRSHGVGVMLIRFDSGQEAKGYYISRALNDGLFVNGQMQMVPLKE